MSRRRTQPLGDDSRGKGKVYAERRRPRSRAQRPPNQLSWAQRSLSTSCWVKRSICTPGQTGRVSSPSCCTPSCWRRPSRTLGCTSTTRFGWWCHASKYHHLGQLRHAVHSLGPCYRGFSCKRKQAIDNFGCESLMLSERVYSLVIQLQPGMDDWDVIPCIRAW